MLRGVNRQIIELNECNSEMFEKAILYVRPEYFDKNPEELRENAEVFISTSEYLKDTSPIFSVVTDKKSKKAEFKKIIIATSGIIATAIVIGLYLLIK